MRKLPRHPRLTRRQWLSMWASLLVTGLLLSAMPAMQGAQAVIQPEALWQGEGTNRSIASILNTDGTLNLDAGISGSFDVNGYHMELGTNGEPRFVPKTMAGCMDNWDDRFGLLGTNGGVNTPTNGSINAIAMDGNGNIYIGGQFMNIGDVIASNVAKWDGTDWSALGDGTNINNNGVSSINPRVYAIAVLGSDVYFGGSFNIARNGAGSTVPTSNIARWSTMTNSWSALGDGSNANNNGTNTDVFSLGVIGSDLYVGGIFTVTRNGAGSTVPTSNIARWNGASWSALGDGTSVNNNGVGGVVGANVRAIAVSGSAIYVGGMFNSARNSAVSTVPASNIARWDGTSWSALGDGTNANFNGVNNQIFAIALGGGGEVYAGGLFSVARTASGSTVPASRIARWDGTSWSALGDGSSSSGNGVSNSGGTVTGLNGSAVDAIAVNGNDVYAAGLFNRARTSAASVLQTSNIARWNAMTNTWSALGDGTSISNNGVSGDQANALTFVGTDLYVGGYFAQARSSSILRVQANSLARWNTVSNSWSAAVPGFAPSHNGVQGEVLVTTADGMGNIYIGGAFTGVGDVLASNVARWNGTSWSALGDGTDLNGNGVLLAGGGGSVHSIATSGNDVYVGGNFSSARSNSTTIIEARNIARWNGSIWSPFGVSDLTSGVNNGTNSTVSAITVIGSDVYVGGIFTQVRSSSSTILQASRIARWNGANWFTLGGDGTSLANNGVGVSANVVAFAVSGSALYVGGFFNEARNSAVSIVPTSNIARWDLTGLSWSALGDGTSVNNNGVGGGANPFVTAMAVSGSDLYVGGFFTQARTSAGSMVQASRIARWNITSMMWSALGDGTNVNNNGVDNSVATVAVNGTDVYVGGIFTQARNGAGSTVAASRIAKWDGTSWSDVDGGVNNTVSNFPSGIIAVNDIAIQGGNVYVGGQFNFAGCTPSAAFASIPTISPPTITASGITRSQGSSASGLQIATVSDDQPEQTLAVTVSSDGSTFGASASLNGVTISGIVVDALGNVTATVVATCTATTASFTLKVTDNQSLFDTDTLVVTVVPDNIAPTINCAAVPAQSANASANCDATVPDVTGLVRAQASDNCTLQANLSITQSPLAGSAASGAGPHPITVTVSDTASTPNQTICIVSFTVTDNTPPTISCPANISLQGNSCVNVNYSAPVVSDNCSGVGTPSCNPPSGTCFPVGTTTVTCSVSDAASNLNTCTFTVSIIPCTITCPTVAPVNTAPGQCSALVAYDAPTTTGQCGTVTCSPASGSTFVKGVTTVTCSTAAGPSCSFTVTVLDNQSPVFAGCSNRTANTGAGLCNAAVSYAGLSASDNCDGTITPVCTPPSGSTFPKGVTTVNCTATDTSSNASPCSFTVTINDNEAPVFAGCSNRTANTAAGLCNAAVSYAGLSASDNCDGTITPVCTPSSGSTFPKGVTTVNCTATDTSANSTPCSFTVTISDNEAPVFAGCSNRSANVSASTCSAVVAFTGLSASDNCDGTITPVCAPSSGSTFPKGVTTVNCTATDTSSNASPCSFTVTISDNEAPVFAGCSNRTANTAAGLCNAAVSYAGLSASDNCDGTITPVCTPPSGSTFPKGVTTVNCTATDTSSNASPCSFTVTISDNEAPVFAGCSNRTANTAAGVCSAAVSYTGLSASDNCDGARTVICAPSSGSTFPKGVTTVNCTATDTSSNANSCSFTVTVVDNIPPSITCPLPVTHNTDPNLCTAVVNYNLPMVSDNCPGAGSPVCVPASGTPFPKGVTTVSCTVMDASGNANSCMFTVTVNDNQPPAIACPPTQVAPPGVVVYPAPSVSDNCAGVGTPICVPASGSTFPAGITTVSCAVMDASGNTSSCSFIVTTFDVCLQDNAMPKNKLLFLRATGDYLFCCKDGSTFTGRGTVSRQGDTYTLTHNTPTRRVSATVTLGTVNKGTAVLQSPPGVIKCSIADTDTTNNNCVCGN